MQEGKVDMSALRVPQRGCISLKLDESRGKKLGTDNLQQCVAVVAHGFTKVGEERVVLMHLDKYTSKESAREILEEFVEDSEVKIIVYGGRDQFRQTAGDKKEHSPQRRVSLDNLRIVNEVIDELGLRGRVDEQSRVGEGAPSPNFIYNPIKREVILGIYPSGGNEIAEATDKVRRAQNIRQGRAFASTEPTSDDERKSPLKHYTEGATPLSASLKFALLEYYLEKGCQEYIDEIEDGQSRAKQHGEGDLMKACSSCQSYMKLVQEVMSPPKIELREIYKNSPEVKAMAEEKMASIQREKMRQFAQGHGRAAEAVVERTPPPVRKATEQSAQRLGDV